MTRTRHFNILKRLMATKVRFVDVYSSFDEVDASLIENILKDRYISCKVSVSDASDEYDEVERRISIKKNKINNTINTIHNTIKHNIISKINKFKT